MERRSPDRHRGAPRRARRAATQPQDTYSSERRLQPAPPTIRSPQWHHRLGTPASAGTARHSIAPVAPPARNAGFSRHHPPFHRPSGTAGSERRLQPAPPTIPSPQWRCRLGTPASAGTARHSIAPVAPPARNAGFSRHRPPFDRPGGTTGLERRLQPAPPAIRSPQWRRRLGTPASAGTRPAGPQRRGAPRPRWRDRPVPAHSAVKRRAVPAEAGAPSRFGHRDGSRPAGAAPRRSNGQIAPSNGQSNGQTGRSNGQRPNSGPNPRHFNDFPGSGRMTDPRRDPLGAG